jgi:L-iditol 2-dehydrogenase
VPPRGYPLGRRGRRTGLRSILVCGGGPAGLLFVQYLRNVLAFEGVLLLSEPNATKRALAERFGAETIDPSSVDVVETVVERTQGRRAELLIEATGSGALFGVIPSLVRKQATILLYGHGHSGVDLGVLNRVQFLEPTFVSPAGASVAMRATADRSPTPVRSSSSSAARSTSRRSSRTAIRRSRPCPRHSPATIGGPTT